MGRPKNTTEPHCRRSHFTWDERLKLQYLYAGSNGHLKERSPTLLGTLMEKSPRTIRRELKRGMVEHVCSGIPFVRVEYNAEHAQPDAEERMQYKGPKPKSGRHHELVRRISDLIRKGRYSPYAALRALDAEGSWPPGVRVCEKTLYRWVEAGDIPDVTIRDLPRKGGMRRTSGHGKKRKHANEAFAARSIDKRPAHVLTRREAGHWEGDTVYSPKDGSRTCLLTLVERKTRYAIVLRMPDRSAASVRRAVDRIGHGLGAAGFREVFRSITFDNGSEFSDVSGLEGSCLGPGVRTTLYFAHPYCSSERGTNENHNGIIRRFLPKDTDFARVADRTVRGIQRWMNTYPRRILDGSTPLERFRQEFGPVPSKCSIMEAG